MFLLYLFLLLFFGGKFLLSNLFSPGCPGLVISASSVLEPYLAHIVFTLRLEFEIYKCYIKVLVFLFRVLFPFYLKVYFLLAFFFLFPFFNFLKGLHFVKSDRVSVGLANVSIVKVTDTNVVFIRKWEPSCWESVRSHMQTGSRMRINKLIGIGVTSHTLKCFTWEPSGFEPLPHKSAVKRQI